MNSKFVTPLIFTSALAIGALSFVACGGDEGSDFSTKPENPTPSSAYVPPEPTPQTSIHFANMAASVVSNKVKFKGDITLDLFDSTAIVDFNAVRFIDLQVTIVNSQNVPTGNYTFGNPIDFNANRVTAINFQEADLYSNLTEGYTECGNFSLMITATASDGILKSVSNYTIPFTRSEEFCKEPESSSSSAPADRKETYSLLLSMVSMTLLWVRSSMFWVIPVQTPPSFLTSFQIFSRYFAEK